PDPGPAHAMRSGDPCEPLLHPERNEAVADAGRGAPAGRGRATGGRGNHRAGQGEGAAVRSGKRAPPPSDRRAATPDPPTLTPERRPYRALPPSRPPLLPLAVRRRPRRHCP